MDFFDCFYRIFIGHIRLEKGNVYKKKEGKRKTEKEVGV